MATVLTAEIAARVELRALVDAYADCADRRDHAGFAALFTSDGELIGRQTGADEPFFRAVGCDALASALHGNDGFPRTFHFVGNHHCEIDGGRASGITYCTAHHLRSEGSDVEAIVWLIKYLDDYARTPDGWRLRRREIELVWVEYADSDTTAFPFRNGWPGSNA